MMERLLWVVIAAFAFASSASGAQFFANEVDWLAAINATTLEEFQFTAGNVALADGVAGPVLDRDTFGAGLNWNSANTGLSFDLQFLDDSNQSGTSVSWVSRSGGVLTSQPQVDHSWVMRLDSPGFLAFAFTTDGAGSFDDGFFMRDVNGANIGAFNGGPSGITFAGFIFQNEGVSELVYSDHTNITGGKPIVGFKVANPILVPEPGSVSLLGLGLACLGWRRTSRHRRLQ